LILEKVVVVALALVSSLPLQPAIGPVIAAKRASVQEQKAPQASPFVLPIAKRDSLLNGLQLIVLENRGTGTVAVRLRLNSGALFDLAGKGGLANLTANLLLRGGGGFNAKSIADSLEQQGLTVKIQVGWDVTDLAISGPADTLDGIFDLLGRVIVTPAFEQKELDALKQQQIAALKGDPESATATDLLKRKATEAIFGGHPYGRPAWGTVDSVAQITRADVTYFYNKFYLANNAELIVSGDVTAEQVTRFGRAKLGAWKKGELTPPSFRPPDAPAAPRVSLIDRQGTEPSQAVIGLIGISRRANDYLAAMIAVDLLSQQLARLAATVPGATIHVEAEARLLSGPLFVTINAPAGDLPRLARGCLDEMNRLQGNPPGTDSVEAAKGRVIAAMNERLRAPDGIIDVMLDIDAFGLGRDYLITYAERINALTATDVQRAAQVYLRPQAAVTVVTGPVDKLEGELKKLGAVTLVK
jgi:zinc protease